MPLLPARRSHLAGLVSLVVLLALAAAILSPPPPQTLRFLLTSRSPRS